MRNNNYDNIVQLAFDKMKESDNFHINLKDVVPKSIGQILGIYKFTDNKHEKLWTMLKSCGMFETHSGDEIKLTELGWTVATDFGWDYHEYKESLKLSVHYSTWIALALSALAIGFQFAQSCEEHENRGKIEILEDSVNKLQKQ